MSFSYNGSSSYTSLGSPSVFDSGAPFSLSMWANFQSTGGEQKLITVGGHGSSPYSLFNITVMPDMRIRWEAGDPNIYAQYSSAMATSTWHHVFASFSGTAQRFYVNGSQIDTRSYTNPAWNNSAATLGRNGGVSEYYLNGFLAEFALWSVALTAEEIAALSKGISPRHIRPDSRFDYIPLLRDVVTEKGRTITNTNVSIVPHPRIYP